MKSIDEEMNNKFIFRSPLLKISDLIETEEELLQKYKTPLIREALFVASADLYNQLVRLEDNLVEDSKKRGKVIINLYKYYTRMCTRCTPFGYFSGMNLGEFDTVLSVSFSKDFHAHTRLDMDYMCNLYEELIKDNSIRSKIILHTNDTLYKVFDHWRYVEYKIDDKFRRLHNLVSLDSTVVLDEVISKCKNGISFSSLLDFIVLLGVDYKEGEEYVFELIKNQILINHIYPTLTGDEYQTQLFVELEKIDYARFKGLSTKLNNVLNSDSIPIYTKPQKIKDLLLQVNLNGKANQLLQIDLLKSATSCQIPVDFKKKIEEITIHLSRLIIQNYEKNNLENFKKAYYERYDGVFMPLTLVLDPDLGIGYKKDDNNSPRRGLNAIEKKIKEFKLNLYLKANKHSLNNIELSEKELVQFNTKQDRDLPPSYCVLASLFKQQNGKITSRYENGGCSSSINLIGRFAHLAPEIKNLCISQAEKEQECYPDAIIAEIVHFPQGRVGNVLSRPHFRKYEITYLGFSTLPKENQINVNDLFIGIVNDRVVLFSKKHNKEIIPRLSTAHNYHFDSLPIYEFLCDLQSQNTLTNVYWSWDDLNEQEFLPRITYKDSILSPAKWNIDTSIFANSDLKNNLTNFIKLIDSFKIPQQFVISQADNDLFIDIQSELGRATFLGFCNKEKKLTLEEFFFDNNNVIDGYTNEVIILYNNNSKKKLPLFENLILENDSAKPLGPFSNCIFLKLYIGKKYAEKLLIEIIPKLVTELKNKKIILKWFFIRYSDPNHHIRIRFFLTQTKEKDLFFQIIQKHLGKYLTNNIIWDLQIATYKRELERYGRKTIIESENWFFHNSELVLKLLPLFKKLKENDTIAVILYYVDILLNQFGLNSSEKFTFCEQQSVIFNNEFDIKNNNALKTKLNNEFRSQYPNLKIVIDYLPTSISDNNLILVCNMISLHALSIKDLIKSIKEKNINSTAKLTGIIASFIHMFINRLFNDEQRYKEMVVYYLITKYYGTTNAQIIFNQNRIV